ncbi:hypothetical protein BpHYR1_000554 [Brachionus plicatilis]|uniref:Uncharacterized protein n=1 Tax=Brachionus plicatilis TaxID=10195 RepID=A0A3M7PSY6_BRAPC|nr:hypothetical protein BpHYR1_000554 [Brachionus plicatilis]
MDTSFSKNVGSLKKLNAHVVLHTVNNINATSSRNTIYKEKNKEKIIRKKIIIMIQIQTVFTVTTTVPATANFSEQMIEDARIQLGHDLPYTLSYGSHSRYILKTCELRVMVYVRPCTNFLLMVFKHASLNKGIRVNCQRVKRHGFVNELQTYVFACGGYTTSCLSFSAEALVYSFSDLLGGSTLLSISLAFAFSSAIFLASYFVGLPAFL